ncbi:MAG: heme o synthase [Gaiellaceae bacterium]
MSTAVVSVPAIAVPAWRDVITLLKLRIGALVVLTAAAAAFAAGGRDGVDLLVLLAACLAASSGASALNHYLDRDLDARMARTAGRPLPSGRIGNPRAVLWLGLGLVIASQAAGPLIGWLPALYLLAGAAVYAGLYTALLKRRTPYSIVIGGAAGSFAALAGWETAASTWSPAPQLLAAVLFLWTPSHFWSLSIVLEQDYRAAGVPALSAVAGAERTAAAVWANTLALVAASLALAVYAGPVYLAVALPAGAGFLLYTHRLRRDPVTARAWLVFKLSGTYLLALLAALVLSTAV